MRRMILHAGTLKTGTTSLQQVLTASREALREQGVWYPDSSPFLGGSRDAHFHFVRAFTHTDDAAVQAARRFLTHLEGACGSDETVLLSAEPLYLHRFGVTAWEWTSEVEYWTRRDRYLRQLARELASFELHVVLVLRRVDEFAESLYKEVIGKGFYRGTFDRFVDDWAPLFDYDRHVGALERLAGVEVLSYHAGPVVQTFATAVGVTLRDDGVWERTSPDARLVLWIAQQDPTDRNRQRAFLLSREAGELFDPDDRPTLWASTAARDRFLERSAGDFGRSYFPAPPTDAGPAARLSSRDRNRIDAAYRAWCVER